MTPEHLVHRGDAALFRRARLDASAKCHIWFCACANFVYSPFTLRF